MFLNCFKACDHNCNATTGCARQGGGKCDGPCKLGFGLNNSTFTCQCKLLNYTVSNFLIITLRINNFTRLAVIVWYFLTLGNINIMIFMMFLLQFEIFEHIRINKNLL